MNLQTIKSMNGCVEYVLLPISIYDSLRPQITKQLKKSHEHEEYEIFNPADYIDNPVALARIQMGMTQADLAKRMAVTQAYISKIENQETVTPQMMLKVTLAIARQ